MKTLSRNIAIVALAFGVSGLAMAPVIANAAENNTYQTVVPNNDAGPNGGAKEHDQWLATHPENASDQNAAPEVSHEVLPNNHNGPNGAAKEHDQWQAKNPDAAYNPNTAQTENDQVVPDNHAGPNGADKQHEIWVAKQAAKAQSNTDSAATK